MSRRPPNTPKQLQIWQQNERKSIYAHESLLLQAKPEDWDLIVIQEPWLDKTGRVCGSQYWRILYPANYLFNGQTRCRSIILINTNISTECYTSIPLLHSDITGIKFTGDFGNLSIINIYNEITNNDNITFLDNYISNNPNTLQHNPDDYMIWLGDFNLL